MRIFLAGASGVIGRRLVPLLVAQGHQVVGMTRSPEKIDRLRELGAEPIVCDVFDVSELEAAVAEAAPDLVMHQLTDLPNHAGEIPAFRERNNRMRTEGTHNLISASRAAGVNRFIAQSIAWSPPGGSEAVKEHERSVLDFGGVILRYGQLYGPGTYFEDELPEPPRIHVDAAAQRTAELLDSPGGIVVITETVE
ncbi:MAG: NAD(P)-dependent oxidoreductase [Solirubrobacterales bacterium]|nr:NAD(P)-dependent oxidoreductase [Solirubrobacterales bacterium]